MVFKLESGHDFCDAQSSKGNNSEAELPFFHSARHLMLIDICIKFRKYSLSGFLVIEWTQFVTDRRTPRENNFSPTYRSRQAVP